MSDDQVIWKAKLLARIHDPAEKALVLLRDPLGHEGGTVGWLRHKLFPSGIDRTLGQIVHAADTWAAAADRPQWPRSVLERYADQIRFYLNPVIIHPLTGQEFKLKGTLEDQDLDQLKAESFEGFTDLIVSADGVTDYRKTTLAFWRFGPDRAPEGLGVLWGLLPADTRVPDHSIWSHLDLTSAFSAAMQGDDSQQPALLLVSLGPVQSFIAQARSTSDLWAGSHLLSQMTWQAMKVICEKYGPDQIIFPQLRGAPEVDAWLMKEVGLGEDLFKECEWPKMKSDSNPLFAAAFPNRFIALVPASVAEKLPGEICDEVRQWINEQATEAIRRLFKETNQEYREDAEYARQRDKQLDGFPELHFSIVPWTFSAQEQETSDLQKLISILDALHPQNGNPPHFLKRDTWKILSKEVKLEGARFYKPNPGVLYPAVYDATDRVHSAAKTLREFDQSAQQGYRCTLCGEREWLTDSRDELTRARGQREETLWSSISKERPRWARKGDHLCAICTLKRIWPDMISDRVRELVPNGNFSGRFVLSTHTLAMAADLEDLAPILARRTEAPGERQKQGLENLKEVELEILQSGRSALPKRLADSLDEIADERTRKLIRCLPSYRDDLLDQRDSEDQNERQQAQQKLDELNSALRQILDRELETYHAWILMDGDDMGKWLSGDETVRTTHRDSWHDVIKELAERFPELRDYANSSRAASPSWHVAISQALNAFALNVVRPIVEDFNKGRLIYAGGDDVLAMVSVDDVLDCAMLLRLAYSGLGHKADGSIWKCIAQSRFRDDRKFEIKNGHLLVEPGNKKKRRLYQMMGDHANASCGIVIAHHMAPLAAVLRELRVMEREAKQLKGKNGFAIRIMKRSGSVAKITCPWFTQLIPKNGSTAVDLDETPMAVLMKLREKLAKSISRRAAYITSHWLERLPELTDKDEFEKMVAAALAYQLSRQAEARPEERGADQSGVLDGFTELAKEVVRVAREAVERQTQTTDFYHKAIIGFIKEFLSVAEFLSRQGRVTASTQTAEVGHDD